LGVLSLLGLVLHFPAHRASPFAKIFLGVSQLHSTIIAGGSDISDAASAAGLDKNEGAASGYEK
jgi:hypothetical protein